MLKKGKIRRKTQEMARARQFCLVVLTIVVTALILWVDDNGRLE